MGRKDGIRVREADPMYYLVPHFLTKRYDAMNMITIDLPVEPMKQYINEKRREGKAISHLALILAAYVKTVKEFPSLNRFVVNRRIYDHNDLTVSMVVLRPKADDNTMSKIYFDFNDTIFDVQRKIDEYINSNREPDGKNLLDKTMKILIKMNWLMRFAISFIYFLDQHNMLPKALIKASPFHASLLISNLASIRTNHIYHHVYEFGTTSIAMTIGNAREVPRRRHGEIEFETCMPIGLVMDERICSGHYFAQAFALMKRYTSNPKLLEEPLQDK